MLCAARTKHLPLDSMYWARMVLYLTRQQGRSTDDYLFSDDGTTPWTMAAAWYRYIWPRLDQLQREGKGGILATDDLDAWGSNSFRISWTTFCSNAPDPVDKTLMDKQGRWRTLHFRPSFLVLQNPTFLPQFPPSYLKSYFPNSNTLAAWLLGEIWFNLPVSPLTRLWGSDNRSPIKLPVN